MRQENNKKVLRLFYVLFCVYFAITPLSARAVVLYLEPDSGQHYLEDVFVVEIKLDTEKEEINTVKVDLTFPQDILEVKDFSQGNSILTLFAETPTFSNQNGKISFLGGIPGGYRGGDGLLGKIIFKAKKGGEGILQIKEDSQILLNDGLGTPVKLTVRGGAFTILSEKLEVPKDEWQEELEKDKIPPEPFEIKISQDPSIFEGKYFIVFSTTDKQTGVDYYEIKEGKKDWKIGESPYLLEDQGLKNKILVKVVDKVENERIAEVNPTKQQFPYRVILLILGLIVFGWSIYRIIQKRKKTHKVLQT